MAARIAALVTSLSVIDGKIDNYARVEADLGLTHSHQEEVPA